MSPRTISPRPWALALLALAAAGSESAYAAPPAPKGSAAPAASTAPSSVATPTSATPSADASAGPSKRPAYVPDLTQPPPPAEPSPAPTVAEWFKAPAAPEVRVTDPNCAAKRIREWYRFECTYSHVSLISGTREGLAFVFGQETWRAAVAFPARRGDVRALVFSSRGKYGIGSQAIVSEQWLDGDPVPLISLTGIPSW